MNASHLIPLHQEATVRVWFKPGSPPHAQQPWLEGGFDHATPEHVHLTVGDRTLGLAVEHIDRVGWR